MKKLILILIGILMFIGCAMIDDLIKPKPANPLINNLRVTLSWAKEPFGHSCISTLDDKWVPVESWPDLKKLLEAYEIQVALINRGAWTSGWNKDFMRIYGTTDRAMIDEMWTITEPIRDLIDKAIPADEVLTLEWWSTNQYRILFIDSTALDIDKMASYVDKMIAIASEPQANRFDKGGGEVRVVAEFTEVKGDTMAYPEGWMKPTSGGPIGPFLTNIGFSDRSGWWPRRRNEMNGPHPISRDEMRWPDPDNYPSVPGGDRT